MKWCNKCGLQKQESQFYSKKKVAGGVNYLAAYCKECDKARILANRRSVRRKLVEYGGGKCKRCGYDRCIWAMEFHHRDERKEFNISLVRSFNPKVRKELDRCDLLCANCHREAHHPGMS